METKHTPGPWAKSLSKTRFGINAPSFHRLATAWIRPEGGHLDEIEANARLIAAAPDLLAACLDTLQAADEMDMECPNAEGLRAAIAKATGAPA